MVWLAGSPNQAHILAEPPSLACSARRYSHNTVARSMSACLRCKTQKLRCIKSESDASGCDRCTRIGVHCVPAPPSRQGKRPRPEEEPDNKAMGASKDIVKMISRLAKQLGQADSCAYFLLGFFQATKPPPKDTIVWMLCH